MFWGIFSGHDDGDEGGHGDHCHSGPNEESVDKVAKRKLLIACGLCLIFMIGEATGMLKCIDNMSTFGQAYN